MEYLCNNLSINVAEIDTGKQMALNNKVRTDSVLDTFGGSTMRGTSRSISILIVITALMIVITALMVVLSVGVSWADSRGFLYIPGIHGSADDPVHRNWIEVLSCDWGAVPPPRGSMVTAAGKGPAGKLYFGDFSFLKHVDESSRMLTECCERNVVLSHIRVELPEGASGSFKYLVLRKVKVMSVRPGKIEKDGSQTEVVTVSFRQVEYQ